MCKISFYPPLTRHKKLCLAKTDCILREYFKEKF